MPRPTIKEVSRLANVSVSTVSRVINNLPDVNAETKQKVWDVINTCGYVPNTNARNLKQISTNIILIVVKGIQNLFFTPIVERIHAEIEKTKYIPFVHYIDESDDEVESAFCLIAEKKAVGVIFMGGSPFAKTEMLAKITIPCVFSTLSAEGLNLKNVSSVGINDKAGAKKAIDYLMEMGHRRIAVLGGRIIDRDSIYSRYEGVLECFKEHGMEFDPKLYIQSKFTYKDAYSAVTKSLADHHEYTAIFAMSDIMAIGAAKAIFDSGLSVPKDISIVGFDGIQIARYYNPTLATIKQPSDEIAQKSVKLLIQNIEKNMKSQNVILGTELITGDSVKRC